MTVVPTKFFEPSAFEGAEYSWLPFYFERLNPETVLVTNYVGEYLRLTQGEFLALTNLSLDDSPELRGRLLAKQIIRQKDDSLPLELLGLKLLARNAHLPNFTSLHIMVVTLRCEHSCPYCQVSRQLGDPRKYDMTEDVAFRSLDMIFKSPSQNIKIEFQGGEPLMNFELIEKVVARAKALNEHHRRNLAFVIATNLALISEDVLNFCKEHEILISTSLDGPSALHNRNRPRPGNNSWELAVEGIGKVQEALGPNAVSALMTTTEKSLNQPESIVDSYVSLGLHSIFLRPLSPYGFAVKKKGYKKYSQENWLEFYEQGLNYIIDQNLGGYGLREQYAAIILSKMLSNAPLPYVDLSSPAGAGIMALVYNFDGGIYASDEGRMLAEMGDETFRLGNVETHTWQDIFLSDELLEPLEKSLALSAPGCSTCAFRSWCGSEPVFHKATQDDVVGHKSFSAFCERNMGVFRVLLAILERNDERSAVLRSWVKN